MSDSLTEKTPLTDEQIFLAGLLAHGWQPDLGVDLDPSDFEDEKNRQIWVAIKQLSDDGAPVDLHRTFSKLSDNGVRDFVLLSRLIDNAPLRVSIGFYAARILEASVKRESKTSLARVLSNKESKLSDLEEVAQKILQGAAKSKRASVVEPIKKSLSVFHKKMEEAFNNGGTPIGLETGFSCLDSILCGIDKGDLIILAARPSMGKTSLALHFASNIAEKDLPVLIISLEMPGHQLAGRLVAMGSRSNYKNLRIGQLSEAEWSRTSAAFGKIAESKIFIDDKNTGELSQVESTIRQAKNLHDIQFCVIDYLQLMSVRGKIENRTQEVSKISRALKRVACEIDVPIVALSQLNRALEQRTNKRPILSDLRESGSLEQDADAVLFLFRPEYYAERGQEVSDDIRGVAFVDVAKHRHGPTGVAELVWHKESVRFTELRG